MNLIRIAILLAIAFSLNFLMAYTSNISLNNSHQTVNRTTRTNGELPDAYEVKIFFLNDGHEHTHTLNGGNYSITVDVMGSLNFLSSGELNQVHCNLNCSIYSEDVRLSGDIQIQRTKTILGNSDESEIIDEFRDDIVETLLNEIQKI